MNLLDIHEHELRGCAPEPLMAYLKALGIFRLVSEQKDSSARAWWQNDNFYLSSTLTRDALVKFFLHEYRPTPIVSPWNNRYKTGVIKGDKSGLDIILSSSDERFSDYRCTIVQTKQLLEEESDKGVILSRCRTQLSDKVLEWVDAVYVLTGEKPRYPPLTSNGGTLGTSSSGDISMNFAKNLVEALGLRKRGRRGGSTASQDLLSASMFDDVCPALSKNSGGQFLPGGWGPNASVGFDADALINPWDFLFMVEGLLVFAGAATRRLSPESQSNAVFPFTVDTAAAGYATSTTSEYGAASRAEFWVPLWEHRSKLGELLYVAREGRARLGRRQATDGIGFVRALAGLGVERGISTFRRFGFMQRTGKDGVFATPIGKFVANAQPNADVLFELDTWLDIMRKQARGNKVPAGLRVALRQVDSAIIEFCQSGEPYDLQNVLIAVGHAERWLSKSSLRKDNNKGKGVRPLNYLSHDWLNEADDKSREFWLARAMASILPERVNEERKVGPIRENMEPVDTSRRTIWKDDSVSFVWTSGNTLSNMLAVLERRCLEGRMQSLEDSHPPLNSAYSARLSDIAAFLEDEIDEQRVADLALPLSFMHYQPRSQSSDYQQEAPFNLPVVYAVMKLTLLTDTFYWQRYDMKAEIRMEPQMLLMLRADRVREAYRVACRRLKASGLRPLSEEPGIVDRPDYGRRLAAALLFPLDKSTHKALAERALWRPSETVSQSS